MRAKKKRRKSMWWFTDTGWYASGYGDYRRVWNGLDVDYGTGYHQYACSTAVGCGWVY